MGTQKNKGQDGRFPGFLCKYLFEIPDWRKFGAIPGGAANVWFAVVRTSVVTAFAGSLVSHEVR